MAAPDTLRSLAEEMAGAFLPLGRAIADPPAFEAFMRELGWDFTGASDKFHALGERITRISERLGTPAYTVVDLLADLVGITDDLRAITGNPLPGTVDASEFRDNFPRELVDHVLVDYLMSRFGAPGPFLLLIGAIRVRPTPADAAKKRLAHLKKSIAWEEIADLLSDPALVFTNAYDWGTPNFRGQEFLEHCAIFFHSIGIEVRNDYPSPAAAALLDQGALVPPVYGDQVTAVLVPDDDPNASAGAGFSVRLLQQTATALPGFSIVPAVFGTLQNEIPITDELTYIVEVTGDLSGGFGISVRPANVSFRADLLGTGDTAIDGDLNARMGFRLTCPTNPGFALLSNAEGSGLFIKAVQAMLGARLSNGTDPGILIEGSLIGGKILVKTSGADGFLKVLLGSEGINADFDLAVGWSSIHGVYLGEGNGIEILIPLHRQLGPLGITAVMIGLKPNGRQVELPVAFDANAALGPLQVVVMGVGVKAFLNSPQAQNGNLGPIDLSFGFMPPTGAGLSLDVGAVRGGGFLYIDPDRGEYAGIAQLSIVGLLTVTAIGIITTRMPDGSDGFSLLLIISVSFEPGIQLGYGFTLGGLGGIVGLNRTMVLEALATGVRTGTVSAILFPTGDIIPQAPRIISDLRAIFPPEEGKLLIGPMAKIGWGTPTLISVSMGLIIEIPGNIAIIGVIRCGLPTEAAPIVTIQVAFVGALDFGKGQLFFFAALFDSKLLTMTLEGEAGLLLAWGDDPNFVISVGGFHPRFDPPPLPFPAPERLALTILNEDFGKVRLEAYFAITSNTAQLGARAELFFGYTDFSLSGHQQFDVLLRFSPFYLIAEMSGQMTLKVFGNDACSIRIEISLEGPTPWTARVEGSVSCAFLEYEVDFTEDWGGARDTSLPPIQILPLLKAELEKLANWTTELPPANRLLTAVRDLSESAETLVLHPLGALRISQRLVPIGVSIDKVGNQRSADADRFELQANADFGLVNAGAGDERFAMAQFIDMSDAQKLSLPAFELASGGVVLGVNKDLRTRHAACRTVRYEEYWIDDEFKEHRPLRRGIDRGLFAHFVGGSAIATSKLSTARAKAMDPFKEKVSVRDAVAYVVADADTNKPVDPAAKPTSHRAATERMQRIVQQDPARREGLIVIPVNELVN